MQEDAEGSGCGLLHEVIPVSYMSEVTKEN
jgi:hypothetical protein